MKCDNHHSQKNPQHTKAVAVRGWRLAVWARPFKDQHYGEVPLNNSYRAVNTLHLGHNQSVTAV